MKINRRNKKNIGNQIGFSLIEILVVMSMMAVLMGIVASRMQDSTQRGNVKATRLMIKKLEMEMESFNSDMGYYPKELIDLVDDIDDSNWLGPYVNKKDLKDAWNQDLHFRNPGEGDSEYSITSYGKDKAAGGEKFNKDINSWEI